MAKTEAAFSPLDFTKAMKDFKIPGVNIEEFVAMQRRNFEALTQANQLATEGFQALAKRQAEIVKESMEEFSTAVKDMMSAGTPEANAAKQRELGKYAFEKALSNVRELAEMAARSNAEAFDVINKRVIESLDEVKGFAPVFKS